MRIGSLFSGIGGLELGLEWAGLGTTAWQVEWEPHCRAVLRRHWPDAALYRDAHRFDVAGSERVQVIAAGFPCQPHAAMGKRSGVDDERWGWPAVERAIREHRPRVVVLENVRNLLRTGLGRVLRSLAELGYDAEWSVLRAADVGLPHGRARLFVVAYPGALRLEVFGQAYDDDGRLSLGDLPYRCDARIPPRPDAPASDWARYAGTGVTPGLRGRSDGIPERVDRVAALGNAVPPRMSEAVGRLIVNALPHNIGCDLDEDCMGCVEFLK